MRIQKHARKQCNKHSITFSIDSRKMNTISFKIKEPPKIKQNKHSHTEVVHDSELNKTFAKLHIELELENRKS